ncbi:EamA family transporter [Halospeciosus flavus]|uniref:EamA family transporter n=1 Tax=Halospeciosus flavus TaxID=3032283 RepID=A0ABD5Z856_9EURY|nr:EamA family transporter [Halospeciosus flavus]
MLADGISYALLAALVWGCYLFGLKRFFGAVPGAVLTLVVNTCAVAWYLPIALYVGSPVAAAGELATAPPAALGSVALTIVSGAAAFLLFLRALGAGEVSYVAPISKVVPAFVLPLELLLFQTALRPVEILGILVVTVAVYLANYEGGGLLVPFQRVTTSRAAQFALLSAAGYAVSDLGKRVALQSVGIPPTLWVPLFLTGIGVLVAPLAFRAWPEEGLDDPWKFVVAGAGVALGEHVTTLAFSLTSASVAAAVVNGQAVVAVLLGAVFLREERPGIRLAAAVLTVCGVGLIAL